MTAAIEYSITRVGRHLIATIDLEPIVMHLNLIVSIAFIHTIYGHIIS